MESSSNNCSFQPNIIFFLLTLLVTSAATVMLCAAIMTENWEYITWDEEKLRSIEKNITSASHEMNNYKLEWLLHGQVARVILKANNLHDRKAVKDLTKENNNLPALFFAPTHGGIWTFCISITDSFRQVLMDNAINIYTESLLHFKFNTFLAEQHQLLMSMGFPNILCTNYLKLSTAVKGNLKMDWQHRMQNLSISCALVCLIILSSSALIGAFGVTKRQISAVLITGVMYLLAAIFATFSLTIMHFKRVRSKKDCLNAGSTYSYIVEGVIVSSRALEKSFSLNKVNKYFEARIITTGWSLYLGWGGAAMCIFVSILWIFLSKIMRFNPINNLLVAF